MKISEKARTLLAEEYERHGKYPTYAQQAMTSDAEFTMCSLRAIERALADALQPPAGEHTQPLGHEFAKVIDENFWELAGAEQPPVGGECRHDWTDDGEFTMACTECGVMVDCSPEQAIARDQQIALLRAALETAKCDIANAAFALGRVDPGNSWLPDIRKGLAEAKAVLAQQDGTP